MNNDIEKIKALIEKTYQEKHEYRKVSLEEFPYLNKKFYEDITNQLIQREFKILGDIEDVTISEANPSFRTCIRVFVHRKKEISAGIYNVKLQGWRKLLSFVGLVPKEIQAIDLDTEFENGHFISSTNTVKTGLSHPPNIDIQHYPKLSLDDLITEHLKRVDEYYYAHPGTQIILINTMGEAISLAQRQLFIKSAHRKLIGLLTKEELQSIGGPNIDSQVIDYVYNKFEKISSIDADGREQNE